VTRPEREHPRYAHEAAVTFHVRDKQLLGRMTNVSRGGLCADLPEPISAGSEIEIDLQLVFDDDVRSEALRVGARVAWSTAHDELHQIGVSFRPLDADKTELFDIFLSLLDNKEREKPTNLRDQPVDDRFG
jgi:hypothetical protein